MIETEPNRTVATLRNARSQPASTLQTDRTSRLEAESAVHNCMQTTSVAVIKALPRLPELCGIFLRKSTVKFVPSGLFWRSLSRFDRPFVFSFDSEALIVCGAGPRLPFRLPDSMNVNVFVTYSLKLVSPPVFLHTWFVSR